MIDGLTCAHACYDLYQYGTLFGAVPPITKWAYITPETEPVFYGITEVDGKALVVFRGMLMKDFLKVLNVFANPFDLSQMRRGIVSGAVQPIATDPLRSDLLGPVHPGAWNGLEAALVNIFVKYPPQSIQFTGHSFGAMRATLATAVVNASFGTPPLPRVVFAECKSGFAKSAQLANVPGSKSYLNTDIDGWSSDFLYNYPFTVWPELYVHGTPSTLIDYAPDGSGPDKEWGPISRHFMGYYLKGMHGANSMGKKWY